MPYQAETLGNEPSGSIRTISEELKQRRISTNRNCCMLCSDSAFKRPELLRRSLIFQVLFVSLCSCCLLYRTHPKVSESLRVYSLYGTSVSRSSILPVVEHERRKLAMSLLDLGKRCQASWMRSTFCPISYHGTSSKVLHHVQSCGAGVFTWAGETKHW